MSPPYISLLELRLQQPCPSPLSRGWSSQGEETEGEVGSPRLGPGAAGETEGPATAAFLWLAGDFHEEGFSWSPPPTRPPRVLLLEGRASSKDSEKPAVSRGCHLVGDGVEIQGLPGLQAKRTGSGSQVTLPWQSADVLREKAALRVRAGGLSTARVGVESPSPPLTPDRCLGTRGTSSLCLCICNI